jgi:hypothetical protein
MDNENIADKDYELGFNEGYIISKYLPALSDEIAKIKNEAPRIEGMKDGIREFLFEHAKENKLSWLKNDHHKKDKPLDRDLEPDR